MKRVDELLIEEAAHQLKAKYRQQIKERLSNYKFPDSKFRQLVGRAEKILVQELVEDLWRILPKKKLQEKIKKELEHRIKRL